MPDPVDGEHGGVDGAAAGLETQGWIVDAALGIHFYAPLIEFMRYADFEEPHGDRLRSIRKQMQIDVAVIGGGAREHRSDQARLELAQHAHRIQGDAALFFQGGVVGIAPEQSLMFAQRGYDFDVFRQHRDIIHAQPIRRLALCLQEILDAVFGHDSRRFLSESAAQILCTLRKFLGHGL